MIPEELRKILYNKKLGSSELINKINNLFKSAAFDRKKILQSLPAINTYLGHFSAVTEYINQLKSVLHKKDLNKLQQFLENYADEESEKYEKIFAKLFKLLPEAEKIITLSRSGTVLNVLKLWHNVNRKLKVVICESRPMLEGRLLAEDLLKCGIRVEFITDPMMSIYVPLTDAALTGADSVLKNGNIINKAGSKTLALLCREHKKPFYVITTRSKFSKRKNFKPGYEKPEEVWNKQHKNLTVSNIYFEEVDKKLITKIITE